MVSATLSGWPSLTDSDEKINELAIKFDIVKSGWDDIKGDYEVNTEIIKAAE